MGRLKPRSELGRPRRLATGGLAQPGVIPVPLHNPAQLAQPSEPIFFQSYSSNLPTSLTYIALSTRGCSSQRPAGDMGTAWHENHTVFVGFSRANRSAPNSARAAVLYGAIIWTSRFQE
ncbi:hypothetical protein BgiMline_025729 [Biomphalaria glabrata]|nr:hypothetical protein BgiMline_021784 [Biomphalaria glabrata]